MTRGSGFVIEVLPKVLHRSSLSRLVQRCSVTRKTVCYQSETGKIESLARSRVQIPRRNGNQNHGIGPIDALIGELKDAQVTSRRQNSREALISVQEAEKADQL